MQTIHLDVSNKGVVPAIYAKQGDVGRKFRAVITDNGEAYQIPEDALLSVWYSGTSGEGNYSMIGENSAFSIDGNTVTVELITQMLANHGGGNVCMVMNRQDGTQIGTWNIPYIVEQLPGMGSSAAEQYFTALSEVAGKAAESAAKAAEAAATFETDTILSVAGKAADAAATGEALAGKAPAGYGLGVQSELTVISTLTQVDTTKANGWYQVNLIAANQSIGGMALGSMRVDAGAYIVHQTFYGYTANSTSETRVLVRAWSDDTQAWGEWEWVNPPMVEGVEYRTTERWNGNVVYTKLINLGNVPSGAKTISIGVYGTVTGGANGLIRHYAFTATGRSALSAGGTVSDWAVVVSLGDGNAYVNGGAGIGGNSETLLLQVWYIRR